MAIERTITCHTSGEVMTVSTDEMGSYLMEVLGLGTIESNSPFCEKRCKKSQCSLFQAKYGLIDLNDFLKSWQAFKSRASDGYYN